MSNRRVSQARESVRYSLKQSYGVGKIDAQVAGEELARIQARDGQLQASVVVEEARPSEAPLHPAFEWRDKVAAEQYRVWQARNLIRAVHVVTEERPRPSPVYVHCPQPQVQGEPQSPRSGYQPVAVVIQRPDLWAVAVAEATRKVREAEESLRKLHEAAEGSDDSDRLARIAVAMSAASALHEAVRGLH
jgi:hypothetical protein